MSNTTYTINVLDKSYTIRCPQENQETLEQAAHLLENSVKKYQSETNISLNDALVLTALNLCGENLTQHHLNSSTNLIEGLDNEQIDKIAALSEQIQHVLDV